MVDNREMLQREEEARLARHHADHVRWLQAQQEDLISHRSQHSSMRDSMREEEDYAVGSELVGYQFASSPSFSMSDEDVRYRSLDMPPISRDQSAEIEVIEEAPVYRSLPFPNLARQASQQSTSSDPDADASWLAAGRPPLLQRQTAFNRGHTSSDWWLQGMEQ